MMSALPLPAVASVIALLLAIVVSMVTQRNVGLLALALAWIVGVGIAGIDAGTVASGFPSGLFVTLFGVTLLFAIAETNGTLARYGDLAVRAVQGDARWLPLVFFALAALISSVGPGAIASVALIAPVAMVVGVRAGGSPLVMALLVGNGANAGNLSPISTVGIIANSAMADAGLGAHPWRVWLANALAHVLVAAVAYLAFGGWRRPTGQPDTAAKAKAKANVNATASAGRVSTNPPAADAPLAAGGAPVDVRRQQSRTAVWIALWVLAVIVFKWPPGLSALTFAVILLIARAGDEASAVRAVPWGVLLMVCGVSTLVAMLERTGGMELFTTLLAQLATAETVNGAIAFVTGTISSYSSTSGVVLPAFLPTVPGLVRELGGGDPLAVALSITVGSALVDVSPLSTLGALCVAAAPPTVDSRRLFRQLLAWGLCMTVVGALLCQLFAGWMAGV